MFVSEYKQIYIYMETNKIFKSGDRVYHFLYGWGTFEGYIKVEDNLNYNYCNVNIDRDPSISLRFVEKILSFTEYTLEKGGFSQIRPEPEFEKGEYLYFWNASLGGIRVSIFSHCNNDIEYKYFDINGICYINASRECPVEIKKY